MARRRSRAAGDHGPPTVVARIRLVVGLDRAEAFAEPEGRAVPLSPDALLSDARRPDGLAIGALAGADAAGLVRCGAERPEAAVAEGWLWVAGAVVGPKVATDSMAPATRQTARMLASNGITVPCPWNGRVNVCSRRRRRMARSSRW
jgi:hypothetical protein